MEIYDLVKREFMYKELYLTVPELMELRDWQFRVLQDSLSIGIFIPEKTDDVTMVPRRKVRYADHLWYWHNSINNEHFYKENMRWQARNGRYELELGGPEWSYYWIGVGDLLVFTMFHVDYYRFRGVKPEWYVRKVEELAYLVPTDLDAVQGIAEMQHEEAEKPIEVPEHVDPEEERRKEMMRLGITIPFGEPREEE